MAKEDRKPLKNKYKQRKLRGTPLLLRLQAVTGSTSLDNFNGSIKELAIQCGYVSDKYRFMPVQETVRRNIKQFVYEYHKAKRTNAQKGEKLILIDDVKLEKLLSYSNPGRRSEHIKLDDLVEKFSNNIKSSESECIENIDIGGPSMIRAAAKNFESCVVITSPDQYDSFIEEAESNKNHISLPGFFKSNNYTTYSLGKVYHHAKDDIDSWDFYYDIPSEINNYHNWESFASPKNQEITNNDLRPAIENVSSPLRKYLSLIHI